MKPYTDIEVLSGIFLEESWVLGITAVPAKLSFHLDAVLTPDHPEYHPPAPGEQYCYRDGVLEFRGVSRLVWSVSVIRPAVDASGERDFGNIDSFEWDDAGAVLEGSWGSIEVIYSEISLTLT